jgi:hypothetical protein
MGIIKQGVISSVEEIGSLKIMDFSRCNGVWQNNPVTAMKVAEKWMVGRMRYTILEIDMSKYSQRNDWPGWKHTGHHEPLGRMYWNCFFANDNGHGVLEFSDSPDFAGTFCSSKSEKETRFYGDIGQVSASTFLIDVLPRMDESDLWVTVLNKNTQVILEPLCDIGDMMKKSMLDFLGIE